MSETQQFLVEATKPLAEPEDVAAFNLAVTTWAKAGAPPKFNDEFINMDGELDSSPAGEVSENLRRLANLLESEPKEKDTLNYWQTKSCVESLFALQLAKNDVVDSNGYSLEAFGELSNALQMPTKPYALQVSLANRAKTVLDKDISEIVTDSAFRVRSLVYDFFDDDSRSGVLDIRLDREDKLLKADDSELAIALNGLVDNVVEKIFEEDFSSVSLDAKSLEQLLAAAYKQASAWLYLLVEYNRSGTFQPQTVERARAALLPGPLNQRLVSSLRLLSVTIRPDDVD